MSNQQYCDYKDYSSASPETREDREIMEMAALTDRGANYWPLKLYLALDDLSDKRYHHGMHNGILSWLPHGRAFCIHDPSRFETEVMPLYIRMTKLSSFYRQLKAYGFIELRQDGSKKYFYHEMFLRGKPFLCSRVKMSKDKPASRSKKKMPRFDNFPPCYPV